MMKDSVLQNFHAYNLMSIMILSIGPTECQDGVTNNCTQDCTRNVIAGVHECSCKTGFEFALGSASICEGSACIYHRNFVDLI